MLSTRFRALAAPALAATMLLPFASHVAAAPVPAAVAAPAQDGRDFTFTNSSGVLIQNLYVERSDLKDWGADILGRDVMAAGDTANVTFNSFAADSCMYDIKVVAPDGSSLEAYQFDLCSISSIELKADNAFYYS
jgi:hypothetical protein